MFCRSKPVFYISLCFIFFPCLIEIYYYLYDNTKIKRYLFALVGIAAVVFYACNFSLLSNSVQSYINCDKKAYTETALALEEVMYLDDGEGAYMLGNPSYLKYYFPLPLQRLGDDSQLECYINSKEQALDYSGKYVSVYNDWFFDGNTTDIENKLKKEYHLVTKYAVFSPPHVLGSAGVNVRYYELYERN